MANPDNIQYITNQLKKQNILDYSIILTKACDQAATPVRPKAHIYYSDQTDPVLAEQAAVLGMVRHEIPSLTLKNSSTMEIDANALISAIQSQKEKDPTHFPVISLNIGSETGAIDSIQNTISQLDNNNIHDFIINLNASIGGSFQPEAIDFSKLDPRVQTIHMRVLGTSEPTGVVMVRTDPTQAPQKGLANEDDISYLKTKGHILLCTRNGHQPLEAWIQESLIQNTDKIQEITQKTMAMADWLTAELQHSNIDAKAHPSLPYIYIPTPSDAIVKKWHLKPVDDTHSYVFVRPDISKEQLKEFITDITN